MSPFAVLLSVYAGALAAGLTLILVGLLVRHHRITKAYRETVVGFHYSIDEQARWKQEPVLRCDLHRIQPNTPEQFVLARRAKKAGGE